jgi:hypothetical protein
MRYRVKAPFSERNCLPTAISGIGVVDLTGRGFTRIYPATLMRPEKKVFIPGATQTQLEILYKQGSKLIEEVKKPASKTENED